MANVASAATSKQSKRLVFLYLVLKCILDKNTNRKSNVFNIFSVGLKINAVAVCKSYGLYIHFVTAHSIGMIYYLLLV